MFLVSFMFNQESATYFWSVYLKIVFNLWKSTFLNLLFRFLTIVVLLEPLKKKKKIVVNKVSAFVGLAAPAKQFEWLPFCFSCISFLSLIA